MQVATILAAVGETRANAFWQELWPYSSPTAAGNSLLMTADGSAITTGADAFIERLVQLGIHTIYANAGTDFPPIIEALAKAAARGSTIQAIAVPHENLAASMAYGHFLVSGQPQAAMLHVNVGTANAVCALMNAFRQRVPLIVAAGRTPYTEKGNPASRSGRRSFHHHQQRVL